MKTKTSTRRTFRRRLVQIEVKIRFKPPPSFTKTGDVDRLTLVGRTKNISETGMALVVSAKNIDRYLTRKENSFDVELRLPAGPLVLQAVPVYFRKITSGGIVNYLIGSCFTNVHDKQLTPLVAFLRSLPYAKTIEEE